MHVCTPTKLWHHTICNNTIQPATTYRKCMQHVHTHRKHAGMTHKIKFVTYKQSHTSVCAVTMSGPYAEILKGGF